MLKSLEQGFKDYGIPFASMVMIALVISASYGVFLTSRLSGLADAISADIQNPLVEVRISGRTVILEGIATDSSESDRCEAIAIDYVSAQRTGFLFGATRVVNLIAVKKTQKSAKLEVQSFSPRSYFLRPI